MKTIIDEASELIGKTIAGVDDSGKIMDAMIFSFTDGSLAVVDADLHGRSSYDIDLLQCNEIEDTELMRMGAITNQEYEERIKRIKSATAERQKERELKRLSELKAKYEAT